MRWPFVTRKVHELEMDALRAILAEAENRVVDAGEREEYWRTRCERLSDAALARAGAISAPTMVAPPEHKPSGAELLARAFGQNEIDTGRLPAS
jgi:hypothetical protein